MVRPDASMGLPGMQREAAAKFDEMLAARSGVRRGTVARCWGIMEVPSLAFPTHQAGNGSA
jgi:hypothetical protein